MMTAELKGKTEAEAKELSIMCIKCSRGESNKMDRRAGGSWQANDSLGCM